MSFYGHTLCFLNCHLAAHMQYALERVDEFEYIMDTQTFDCKKTPKVIDHRWGDKHHTAAHSLAAVCNFSLPSRLVFWFGDLNFRIQDHGIHFVRSCISSQNYNLLWSKDQVTPRVPRAFESSVEESAGVYDKMFSLTVERDEGQRRAAPAVWGRASGISAHVQVWFKLGYLW